MGTLWTELRHASRRLRQSPGFTLAAVLTLALGVGANVAVFRVLHAVLLETLPVRAPGELVQVLTWTPEGGDHADFSYPLYRDYAERATPLAGVLAYSNLGLGFAAGERTERVMGDLVSANYFDLLGVEPALGRGFAAEEEAEPGAAVAVLGHGLWQRAFAGRAEVVGERLRLNGHLFTIIGVAPPEFRGLTRGVRTEVFVPLGQYPALARNPGVLLRRTTSWLTLVARLPAGAAPEAVEERLQAPARFFEEAGAAAGDPESFRPLAPPPEWRVVLRPAAQGDIWMVAGLRDPLRLVTAMVALLLLIAAANVANLLLARDSERRREIGVRLALGAGRGRLAVQQLAESLLLALGGGALGLLLAAWVTDALVLHLRFGEVRVEGTPAAAVLLYTLGLAGLAGLLCGVLPAVRAARRDPLAALRPLAGADGRRRPGPRDLLVVAQVALALVVLAGAGIFLRSLQRLRAVDTGLAADRVVAASLDLDLMGYDEARGRAFQGELLRRLEAEPGVQSASLAFVLPVTAGGMRLQRPPQQTRPALAESIAIDVVPIAPRFFATVGLPLVAGRDFTAADDQRGAPVAIVNRTMAARLWPDRPPHQVPGERFFDGDTDFEVVAVAADTKYRDLRETPRLALYRPLAQMYRPAGSLLVRSALPTEELGSTLRRAVGELDPALPLFGLRTLRDHVARSLEMEALRSRLLLAFALLAVALVAIGVYALLAYAVAQRTRELGIRVALGARRGELLRMILRRGLGLAGLGLALGLAASLLLARLVSSQLYGTSPNDPATLAACSLALAGVAALASLLPARRATRVDPMVALRQE